MCVCLEGEVGRGLSERYHGVGGGRRSVSERAARRTAPCEIGFSPMKCKHNKLLFTQQFYTRRRVATQLHRICLPLPLTLIHVQLISNSCPRHQKRAITGRVIYYTLLQFIGDGRTWRIWEWLLVFCADSSLPNRRKDRRKKEKKEFIYQKQLDE